MPVSPTKSAKHRQDLVSGHGSWERQQVDRVFGCRPQGPTVARRGQCEALVYSGAAFHGERRMDVAQTERRAPAPFPTGRRRTTTSQPRQVLAAAALIGIGIFD
jgi:hypothetical protein